MPSTLTAVPLERAAGGTNRTDGLATTRRGSLLFVAAWIVGLALHPNGVTSADSTSDIVEHYLDHRVGATVQVLLVHGIAAVALLLFAVGLGRFAASDGHDTASRWSAVTGRSICLISLVQAGLGLAMIASAGTTTPSTTRQLLLGIERLDAVKLLALATLCGTGIALGRAGIVARWNGKIAALTIACLLPAVLALSGITPVLAPAAIPALVLLLIWVGSTPFAAGRAGA